MRNKKSLTLLSFPRKRESTVPSFLIPVFTGMTLCLLAGLTGSIRAGTYSGGTGEPNDPYLIATAEDMNAIGADSNDWDAHFLLVADINLSDYTGTQFNIIGYYISSSDYKPFTGVFDGNNHTISNFTYECNDDYTFGIGIFGYVDDPNAEIKNLTLINPDVNAAGYSYYIGSLVGLLLEHGLISSCGVEGGRISGSRYVGGLVGWNDDTLSNCYSTGSASGFNCTGGLVGCNSGSISNCYATGSVLGDWWGTGGLVGGSAGTGTISNCYANGNASGNNNVGGLAGYNWGTTSNCYATGSITGNNYVGGLVGYGEGVLNSFWDVNTSGQTTSDGGTPKTTAEMKTKSTFTGADWDFIEIWDIGENQTYPFLRVYPAGDLNHDDIVNFYDLAILADHWLE